MKKGFLLIELAGTVGLLGVGGLIIALMISSLSTIARNVVIQGKATTLLHKTITYMEKSHRIPANSTWQEGPFSLSCKTCTIPSVFKESVPFQLVRITISWQSDQSISGIVGMLA